MAGFIEYEKHDATGLAALIAGGQVSATEVLEAAIERAERWQPSINAITIPLYEHARAAARTGLPAGSLSGVPRPHAGRARGGERYFLARARQPGARGPPIQGAGAQAALHRSTDRQIYACSRE